MHVIFEPPIAEHDPTLYEAKTVTPIIDGFAAVGDEELRLYERTGFLAIRKGLSLQQTDAAIRELETMLLSDDPRCESIYFESAIRDHLKFASGSERERADALPTVPAAVRASLVRKLMGFVPSHPALAALVQEPGLLRVITRIIGEPARCFQDMALIKPPYGQEKPWHQDHAYFNFPLEVRVVGVWIALTDVSPQMGCMHVVSGAHRAGPQPHFKRRDWQICDSEMRNHPRLAIAMQAGDVLLFDAKLPHGTPMNRTDRQRFAVQFHFAPCSASQTTDEDRMAIFGSEGKDVRC